MLRWPAKPNRRVLLHKYNRGWHSSQTSLRLHVSCLKCKVFRYHWQFAENKNGVHFVLSASRRSLKAGLSVDNPVIISSPSILIQRNHCPVSLSLFSDGIIQMSSALQSHVYWPKPQCEIQNNCSTQLPWHIVLLHSVYTESKAEIEFCQNKWIVEWFLFTGIYFSISVFNVREGNSKGYNTIQAMLCAMWNIKHDM